MSQPKLSRVGKVLPKYLPRIARERDAEGLLKIWLLDDTPPDDEPVLSPLQQLLRSPSGRRWLDETTGNLVRIYYLDPPGMSSPEPTERLVEVLTRKMPYTLAVHHIASLFRLSPERLPALIGYISLELESYCVLDLSDATDVAEIKNRLAATIEALKSSARDVIGSERVDELLCCREGSSITVAEALRIADGFKEQTAHQRRPERALVWRNHGAGMAEAIETIAKIIRILSDSSPDLVMLVRAERREGASFLRFELEAHDPSLGICFSEFGPQELKTDPGRYLSTIFKDIEQLSGSTVAARRRLEARGALLFKDLLPVDLQQRLWSLRSQVMTFQILSDEPWIPWELMKFQGPRGDPALSGLFFGEAFALTRWLRGVPKTLRLPVTELATVVGGDSALESAAAEREFLESLKGPQRRVEEILASYEDVITALASGRYDGWHFTGHGHFDGRDPNRWFLLLADYEKLMPEDLVAEAANLGTTQPLVFLNACQTGRGGMALTRPGGWAHRLLAAGAGAFIGSLWRIPDSRARDFAEAFYSNFFAGIPIGEAVRQARLTLRDRFPGDPTWLAYTVFAHPLASCRESTFERQLLSL